MEIRQAGACDAPAIVQLIFNTIHRINRQHYSPTQLEAWMPVVPDAARWANERMPGRTTWAAHADGGIVGVVELTPTGLIDCFFVHHERIGQGVGTALMVHLEAEAKCRGLPRLHAEASLTAEPFFAARGFSVVRRQTVVRNGIELANSVMEKAL